MTDTGENLQQRRTIRGTTNSGIDAGGTVVAILRAEFASTKNSNRCDRTRHAGVEHLGSIVGLRAAR